MNLRSAVFAAALAAFLAAATGGCNRDAPGGGNAAVREESRSGLHYRLRSEVAPRRATLGEPVRWKLTAELPGSMTSGPLVVAPAGSALEVKPRGDVAKEGNRWVWTQDVRGFDLGVLALPAARIEVLGKGVRDTLVFPPDTLAVDSLTQARSDSLVPDRGAVPTELRPIDYAVLAGLALLVLAILWFTIAAIRRARARERGAAAPTPPVAPAESYRRALAALRESGDSLSFDVYYERLSEAIRDYAAAVTGVPARDRTTTEIERELTMNGDVPRDGIEALASALRRADLAKFARRAGGWDEARSALAEAERLPERLPEPPPVVATEPDDPKRPAADDANAASRKGR